MSALHHETDDKAVLGKIKEALIQRVGADRFGLWFENGVEFRIERSSGEQPAEVREVVVMVEGEFALQRLRVNYFRDVEAAVGQSLGKLTPVRLSLAEEAARKPEATLVKGKLQETTASPVRRSSAQASAPLGKPVRVTAAQPLFAAVGTALGAHLPGLRTEAGRSAKPIASGAKALRVPSRIPSAGTAAASTNEGSTIDAAMDGAETVTGNRLDAPKNQLSAFPSNPATSHGDAMTFANFAAGSSNQLAHAAAQLLAAQPGDAAPICFWGATGTGKTHLLHAIRHELRHRHRLQRVILLSAEDFTNDFLTAVRGAGLPAFRKRYRDVDALLIDNIQFFGGKSATLREVLYTVDTIISRRRPLVLAGDRPPMEIEGLSGELAGRMSSGLVCGLSPLEVEIRRELLRRESQRSFMPWDEEIIGELASRISGDGRIIQGVGRLVSMLQRMYRRMPTMQEIVREAGDMLQRGPRTVGLEDIEKAVCAAFNLPAGELRGETKSRNVSQPRILAMYLSRQHTNAAFSEIGRYFGDRNHSTVIAAYRRAEAWLKANKPVGGRGPHAVKAQEAIDTVENLLRIG